MESTLVYELTAKQFTKGLENLKKILDRFQAFAETKKFDVSNVLNARLAPDQFNFIRQIQIMTDVARFTCARLTGKEMLSIEDKEVTLDDLRNRIDKTIGYLKTFTATDFKNATTIKVVMPRLEKKAMQGNDHLAQWCIPNFHFHFATAYAILRHNGLDIGKKDYLGEMTLENLA